MNPVLIVVVAGALIFGQDFKLPAFLQKKPQTVQLAQAQSDLAKAQADKATADAALAAIKAQQDDRTSKQLDYAQQFASGASMALARVQPDQMTPEIKLASELSLRSIAGLEAARGKLPPEAQAEMQQLIDEALSAKTAEVEAYKAALDEKDATLQVTIQEKAAIAARIPVLEATVQTANANAQAKDVVVQDKVREVSQWAAAKAESDAKAGSLDAYAGKLVRILIGLGILYALVHFALPSLQQEFPANKILTFLDKTAKSITSSRI